LYKPTQRKPVARVNGGRFQSRYVTLSTSEIAAVDAYYYQPKQQQACRATDSKYNKVRHGGRVHRGAMSQCWCINDSSFGPAEATAEE